MTTPNGPFTSLRSTLRRLRAVYHRLPRRRVHHLAGDGEQSTWFDAEQYRRPHIPPPRSRFPGEAFPASHRPSTYSALTDPWGRG